MSRRPARLLGALLFLAAPFVAEGPASARGISDARTVVVFVPGMTGTSLRERDGRVVWGDGRSLLFPRDSGYATALSFLDPARDALEPAEVLRELRLFRRWPIYGPFLDALEAHGHRIGDLRSPNSDASFFPFAFDWRQDAVRSARELLGQLDDLRRARGGAGLEVVLVCQSTGGHICRYLAKYGGASLEEAEADRAGPPPWLEVRQMILIGSANGGSLRALRAIHRGRRYIPTLRIGRRFAPETLLSYRGLVQDLPSYRDGEDNFLDPEGNPISVDVFDPATWNKYGWSIHSREARERLAEGRRVDLFGTAEQRDDYLRRVLSDTRRFQELLRRNAQGFGAPRIHLIHDVSLDTPDRGVLIPPEAIGTDWTTLFTGDPELDRHPVAREKAVALGDGHSTLTSLLWLSPQELSALVGDPFHVHGGHFDLIYNPVAMSWIIDRLDEPPPTASSATTPIRRAADATPAR